MTSGTLAGASARIRRVALIGNPNTGKTTIFNALTGLSQRVANYPGVTVEKKSGFLSASIELLDLPGAYSLAAHSPDEMVAVNVLLGHMRGETRPDLVVLIVDAGNLQRNLYLATQVMELGLPVILVLNMVDAAAEGGVRIDHQGLARALGVPVIPAVANKGVGLDELRKAIHAHLEAAPAQPAWKWPEPIQVELNGLGARVGEAAFLLSRALIDEGGPAEAALVACKGPEMGQALREARGRIRASGGAPAKLEIQMRYAWIAQAIGPFVERRFVGPSRTDRIDAVVTHRLWGALLFLVLMTGVFMAIFEWAKPLMEGIGALFDMLAGGVSAGFAGTALEGGALHALLVNGVIKGVGSVLTFLPQIALLSLFMALLEDCGYLARAAFLMDRLLRFCGLSGHSFIPLLSSFACAIPGILATRTIANSRDRFATILVAPLMSCSARIPVYAILVGAFVPATLVAGVLPLQGLVFAAMYFVGILVAIPVTYLLKRTLLKGATPAFVMELPTYKRPDVRLAAWRVWEASWAFTVRAGTLIFALSVVIWALCYFPHSEELGAPYQALREEASRTLEGEALAERNTELEHLEAGAYQRQSYFGRLGHWIEPAVRPLGWDWRIGMAALASFPAREVVVSTLGIIYDLGGEVDAGEPESRKRLVEKLQASTWPDGRKVFNLPVALSIMVFFALCCQCGATVATIKRETNSWKWALFAFSYMTVLAYIGALVTYQVASLFG